MRSTVERHWSGLFLADVILAVSWQVVQRELTIASPLPALDPDEEPLDCCGAGTGGVFVEAVPQAARRRVSDKARANSDLETFICSSKVWFE